MLFNSINLGLFWKNNQTINSGNIHMFWGFFFPLSASLLLLGSLIKKSRLRVLSIVIIIIYSISSANVFRNDLLMSNEHSYENFNSIIIKAKEMNTPIYFWDDRRNVMSSFLQMYLYDTSLRVVRTADTIVQSEPFCLFISKNSVVEAGIKYRMEPIDVFRDTHLFKCTEKTNMPFVPLGIFHSQINVNTDNGAYLISDGSEGYLQYGPYCKVKKGAYIFYVDLEVIRGKNEDIGILDAVNSDTQNIFQLAKIPINRADFVNDKISLELPVNILEDVERFELRVFVKKDVVLKITQVRVSTEEITS
jgi:hypothetical protein